MAKTNNSAISLLKLGITGISLLKLGIYENCTCESSRFAILSTAIGCLADATFSWCIMGKKLTSKTRVVKILQRNKYVTVQFVNIMVWYMRMHTKIVIYNYINRVFIPIDHKESFIEQFSAKYLTASIKSNGDWIIDVNHGDQKLRA